MHKELLVIDDSIDIHKLLSFWLKPEQLLIHSAYNGEEGIKKAELLLPALILVDIDMPGMDGFEVCKKLKKNKKTMHIPLVFLSGMSDTIDKVKGFDLGAIDYVTKPFHPAELRARVRAIFYVQQLEENLKHEQQRVQELEQMIKVMKKQITELKSLS